MIHELTPRYDSRKSFYGKARVEIENTDHGDRLLLWSYDTHVATIRGDKCHVFGLYSNTTTRHIKEFLLQNGFKAENSKQIMKDYSIKGDQ